MTGTVLERRRTALDLAVGVLLVLAGLLLLSNVVLATAVSVRLLGWTTLGAGIVLLVRVLVALRSGASWSTAVGGVVLTVVGLFILRNPWWVR